MMFWMAYGGGLVRQRVPLHAWLKSIEFWAITVFLILLGGSVGAFESTKTHPIDWSLCFFVGVGAISTVRNFLSGVAAHGGPRAKRRRLKRQLSRRRVPDGGRFIERKSELRCRFQLIRRLDGAYSNTLLSLAVARARRHLLANA
jgi:hypothetical protein